ncbi:O-antigen ligase family protein [uncultured Gemella sp.]|uniref:sunset domain-containing protein n=1 Tax=uncultured Gemella sp. TaxID=254352 RepID=UPI0028D27AE2|nr:O-antigen ligase family protein [uncultured Gemella sp.]
MNKFIREHGQVILWFIFLVFMIISLSMVFTHGIGYASIVFILSFVLLCPPIVKLIQRKTRLKKVVLGAVSALVMTLTMLMTNHFSDAKKEEQRKTFQEKKEERDKKIEEQSSADNDSEKKEQQVAPPPPPKKRIDEQDVEKNETVQLAQKKEAQAQLQQPKKVIVRASKKNGYYYTPTHPSYNNIAAKNLLVFNSEEAAQKAGYRRAA